MYKVLTLNQIALKGLECLPRDRYEVGSEFADPDAILVRSQKLTLAQVTPRLRAVARAGAGTNNIPVPDYTAKGVVVFNTPGANANSVKELVLAAMLLSSRGIQQGARFVDGLDPQANDLHQQVEGGKKAFKGQELRGKTLGVVGLGAIGSMVASAALALGMKVLGYDPALSVEAAWRVSSDVQRMDNVLSLFSRCDYVTLHVPLLDATRHLVNAETLRSFRADAVLLNFARDAIVDPDAVRDALDAGQLRGYCADFPEPQLLGRSDCLFTPHLGASTNEAEENCAVMAAEQLRDFLEHGNIRNSVNFPSVVLERTEGHRLAVINRNVPRMLGQVMSILADSDINVIDMINKSRDDVAYNLIDVAVAPDDQVMAALRAVEGVISVRSFGAS